MLNAVEEYFTVPSVEKKKIRHVAGGHTKELQVPGLLKVKKTGSKVTNQNKADEKKTGNKEEQRKDNEAPTKTSEGRQDP